MYKPLSCLGLALISLQCLSASANEPSFQRVVLSRAEVDLVCLADKLAASDDANAAGYEIVNNAHNGVSAVRLFSTGQKAAIYNQTGTDPTLKGVATFWYKAVSSTVHGRNLAFYIIPFTSEGVEGGASRTAWFVPSKNVGDGRWHRVSIPFDYVSDLSVVSVQLDPRVNESDETGAGEWLVSGITLHPLPYSTGPKLSIQAFCGSLAPLASGQPFHLVCTILNSGRTAAEGIHFSLSGSNVMKRITSPLQANLPPDSSRTFEWLCRPSAKEQTAWADVRVTSSNGGSAAAIWNSVIMPGNVGVWPKTRGCITIGNSQLRLNFPSLKTGTRTAYSVCSIQRRIGKAWRTVAVLPRLIQIIATRNTEVNSLFAILQNRTSNEVSFLYHNSLWSAGLKISVPKAGDVIGIQARLTAKRAFGLLAFRCPDLRVGEGTFGAAKRDAIFPGLEFLSSREKSSSDKFLYPPNSARWTPNPLRITMPLMSIASDGVIVMLTWNPNERWDGVHEGYSSQFACPNSPMGQDNTRMALFLPTIPKWVDENGTHAERPYSILKNHTISLNSNIVVQVGESAITGVKTFEQDWGWKLPIAKSPRTVQQEIALCEETFLKTLWKGVPAGWEPNTGANPGPDPGITLQLLKLAKETSDSKLAEKMQKRALSLIDAVHNNRANVNLALWTGDVEAALANDRAAADAQIKTQRADGTWGFEPDTSERARLGPRGASNVGICASHLVPIANYALLTRNPEAVHALLKGLAAMDRFEIPAGAQVWECPLGEPDIYAAALAIPVTLAGYQITGDRAYLSKAVHWAWTGVPFVYQWHPPDRAIMLGGSTPVFGSTFFAWSWMGRPVQWNGLAYAASLLDLDPYDRSFDWKRLAASLTDCGMQEEATDNPLTMGCYPDSFHLLSDKPAGPWLNPSIILSNLFRVKEGRFAYPNTMIFSHGSSRWIVTSSGDANGGCSAKELHLTILSQPGMITRLIISAPARPSQVELDGHILQFSTAEENQDGWRWDAADGVVLTRITVPHTFHLVVRE